jgi:hypothetical protein
MRCLLSDKKSTLLLSRFRAAFFISEYAIFTLKPEKWSEQKVGEQFAHAAYIVILMAGFLTPVPVWVPPAGNGLLHPTRD